MLAFHAPTIRLQMRVDGRNSSAQRFVGSDENNVCIVSREWLRVINRGKRSTKRVIFDQTRRDKFVRRAKNISEGNRRGFVGHSMSILTKNFAMARVLPVPLRGYFADFAVFPDNHR